MQQGVVKERGTHVELLNIEDGFYKNLVSRQMVAEEISKKLVAIDATDK